MEIYRDIYRFLIKTKGGHINRKGKRKAGFHKYFGDIPIAVFNTITNKWEPCEITRGYAYALRNAHKYKRNRKKDSKWHT